MDQDGLIQFMTIPKPTTCLMHPVVLQIIHLCLCWYNQLIQAIYFEKQILVGFAYSSTKHRTTLKSSCWFSSLNTDVVFENLFTTLNRKPFLKIMRFCCDNKPQIGTIWSPVLHYLMMQLPNYKFINVKNWLLSVIFSETKFVPNGF